MARPKNLPDFTDPPLDEVVLGVQFAPIPGYTSVRANDIWSLFKSEFPEVEEHPVLEPTFEAFGGSNPQPGFKFQVGPPPARSRLWFISADGNHLLQFQSDRFLANWRRHNHPNEYPRFESVAKTFKENLNVLCSLMNESFEHDLKINQAEIAYINIIPVDQFSNAGEWFKSMNSGSVNVEAFSANFSEVILDENGNPFARLIHDIRSVYSAGGEHKAFRLSLTFRGKPESADISAAMQFLELGRVKIVSRFDEITTDHAHQKWGKTR